MTSKKWVAETGLAAWLVEIERGTAVATSRMTVGECMTYWLETSARHRLRATTISFSPITREVRLILVISTTVL